MLSVSLYLLRIESNIRTEERGLISMADKRDVC
jgi:hypothetical protein